MMDIKEVFLLWFIGLLIKSRKLVVLIMKLNKMNKKLKNYTSQLSKYFKKEQFILHSKTIFGVLIWRICKQ